MLVRRIGTFRVRIEALVFGKMIGIGGFACSAVTLGVQASRLVLGIQLKVDCRTLLVVHYCKTPSSTMNPVLGAESAFGRDSSHLLSEAWAQTTICAEHSRT